MLIYLSNFYFNCGRSSCANAVLKSFTGFAKDMKVLYREKVFVVNVLGNVFLLLFFYSSSYTLSSSFIDACTCLKQVMYHTILL